MPDFKPRSTRRQFRLVPQQGQTLVEFAFVTLIFLIILFGITEFSRALWTWNALVHATREGARYAVVEPSSTVTTIQKYVVYHDPAGSSTPVVPGLSESNVEVKYFRNDGVEVPKATADVIRVGINNYTFDFLVPLYGPGLTLPAFKTTLPLECIDAACQP